MGDIHYSPESKVATKRMLCHVEFVELFILESRNHNWRGHRHHILTTNIIKLNNSLFIQPPKNVTIGFNETVLKDDLQYLE